MLRPVLSGVCHIVDIVLYWHQPEREVMFASMCGRSQCKPSALQIE